MDTRIQELHAEVARLDAQYEKAYARARSLRFAEVIGYVASLGVYTANVIVRSVALSVVAFALLGAYLVVMVLENRAARARDESDTKAWRARYAFLLAVFRATKKSE